MLPNSFYIANITHIPKPHEDTTKKQIIDKLPWWTYKQKLSIKHLQNKFNNIFKRSYTIAEQKGKAGPVWGFLQSVSFLCRGLSPA
jgi:hypothetical protein